MIALIPSTVVVLRTGNPMGMPWEDKARGIVQARHPGRRAIAEILAGKMNPSGRKRGAGAADRRGGART